MTRESTPAAGPIQQLLTSDHQRLDALLARAVAGLDEAGREAYAEFRGGLLRHIGLEEKILLPAAREQLSAEQLAVMAQLRRDHAALGAMLMPPPDAALLRSLQELLARHNPLEEGAAGLYAACERLASSQAGPLLERLRAAPSVRLAAQVDSPRVRRSIDALLAAGRKPDREG